MNFARSGGFLLALAACVVGSPLFFGFNLLAALLRVWCGDGGDVRSFAILATLFVLFALGQFLLGAHAARSHADPFNLWSFLISIGLALAVVMYWSDATAGIARPATRRGCIRFSLRCWRIPPSTYGCIARVPAAPSRL